MKSNQRSLAIEKLESRSMLNGVPTLIDINQWGEGAFPSSLTEVNGTLFFGAYDPGNGSSLWRSDGTAEGTSIIDLSPGPTDARFESLVNFGGLLYFSGPGGLWRSDGTVAGTTMVKNVIPSTSGSSPARMTAADGLLYFFAYVGGEGYEPWRSDGTAEGTFRLKDVNPGVQSSESDDYLHKAAVGRDFYFVANDGVHGFELWKSDGTTAGTILVKDVRPGTAFSSIDLLTNVNGTLFFVANDGTTGQELWKVDASGNGAARVKDIRPGALASGISSMTAVGNLLYFSANDGVNGVELWRSDGTSAGTYQVTDANPGLPSSSPESLTDVNGVLYFVASDGIHGRELWRSDGGVAGTLMVKDTVPGTRHGFIEKMVNANGTLIFSTPHMDGSLWRSDGSEAGTYLLCQFPGDERLDWPYSLTSVGANVFFVADDLEAGLELWATDGSAAGTRIVKDINLNNIGSEPGFLTNVEGKLYFAASEVEHERELWSSDGSILGTGLVKDTHPAPTYTSYLGPNNFHNVAGNLLFSVVGDPGLWVSDGTEAGTHSIGEAHDPDEVATLGNGMIFSGFTLEKGHELWRTDGTQAGTWLVKDIATGWESSYPVELTTVGAYVYFNAFGNQLWRTNGTPAGTTLIKDFFFPGAPRSLTEVNGTLYFYADAPGVPTSLWKSNGTVAGTMPIKSLEHRNIGRLVNYQGILYFSVDDEIWKVDTVTGPVLVKNLSTRHLPSATLSLQVVAASLYFGFDDEINGYELWKSDGTPQGTELLLDINPGPDGSGVDGFTAVGDLIYFTASTNESGIELWRTDGTAQGTGMVSDLVNGADSSYPQELTESSGALYFTATDGIHGRELWVIRAPLAGDYSADGVVDGGDFLEWQRSFGSTVNSPGSGADGDRNGVVDSADLSVWKVHFGHDTSVAVSAVALEATSESVTPFKSYEEYEFTESFVDSLAGWTSVSRNIAVDTAFARLASDRNSSRPDRENNFAFDAELIWHNRATQSARDLEARKRLDPMHDIDILTRKQRNRQTRIENTCFAGIDIGELRSVMLDHCRLKTESGAH